MKKYFVYIVRSSKDKLYTGIAIDVEDRIKTHNKGKGSKALRGQLPVKLCWEYGPIDKSQAMKIETAIKRLPQFVKDAIVGGKKVYGNC